MFSSQHAVDGIQGHANKQGQWYQKKRPPPSGQKRNQKTCHTGKDQGCECDLVGSHTTGRQTLYDGAEQGLKAWF